MSDNCETFREMIFDFIENEDSDDFGELKKHLDECPSCRAEYRECKKLLSAVETCAPSPERDIKTDVMLAVAADAKFRRRRRLVGGLSAIAAAVALFVGVGIAFSGEKFCGLDAAPPNMSGDAMDFEEGNASINDAYLPDDIYEILGSFEESIAVIELCGNDAEHLYELLRDEFSLDETEAGILLADVNQKDKITNRCKELAGEFDAYFSEYSDSASPEIVVIYIE